MGNKVMDKIVLFVPTAISDSYTVVLGDLQSDGSIDVAGTSGKANAEFVLSTVAKAIAFFLSDRPEAEVLIEGSTFARTRLYQIAIARELQDLGNYFDIYGVTNEGLEIFQQGRVYGSFTVTVRNS